jgi:hypothetical protein
MNNPLQGKNHNGLTSNQTIDVILKITILFEENHDYKYDIPVIILSILLLKPTNP